MSNPNYLRGRRFEYARMKAWKAKGYHVMRTAGSHGPFDLIAIKHDAPVELIQCKCLKTGTAKQAEAMLRKFALHHPFVDSRYFHQTLEVYTMRDHQLRSRTF